MPKKIAIAVFAAAAVAACAQEGPATEAASSARAVPSMTREQAQRYLDDNGVDALAENLPQQIIGGDAEAVEALLVVGIDANAKGSLPQSPLELTAMACAGDRVPTESVVRIIDLLLARGADVDAPGMGGMTPLIALAQQCPAAAVKRLIDADADLENRTPQGFTALSMALVVSNYDTAEALADAGAKLSAEAAGKLLDGQQDNTRLKTIIERARGN